MGLGSFVNCFACYVSACCPILLPIVFAPVMGMDDRKIVFLLPIVKRSKSRFCVNVAPLSAHLNMAVVIISSRLLQRLRTPPGFLGDRD